MNVNDFFTQLDELFSKNELQKVEPFLQQSLETAKEEKDYGAYISICNEMIGFYRSVSAFEKASHVSEDVLLLMEELQLDGSEHFATTLLNAATAYRAAGDYAQAYEYYERALLIYKDLIPEEDYRYAGLYNNMSILLEKMERNEEAISCALKALSIIRGMEKGEMETATTLTNLGLLYFKIKQNDKAMECLQEAAALFEQCGDTTDAHYSGALAGIGEAYYHMKEYEKALAFYEKAVAEVEKHFGRNQSYAVLCENCASICELLGAKDKQQMYLKNAGH